MGHALVLRTSMLRDLGMENVYKLASHGSVESIHVDNESKCGSTPASDPTKAIQVLSVLDS